ncbi:hypothetical protein Arub01_47080 [Actinomadura rubrobrunea]|uniref:Uncharacterized protein n=1 Tax=Actinomadura rubrobrunea TaxID=115335 RepID=A0A9W6PXZ0_9ACTN|nr:hypothetical protein Arub01_47080 [Actinomadura rubrobrunea]
MWMFAQRVRLSQKRAAPMRNSGMAPLLVPMVVPKKVAGSRRGGLSTQAGPGTNCTPDRCCDASVVNLSAAAAPPAQTDRTIAATTPMALTRLPSEADATAPDPTAAGLGTSGAGAPSAAAGGSAAPAASDPGAAAGRGSRGRGGTASGG